MSNQTCSREPEDATYLLTRITVCSAILTLLLVVGSWMIVDWSFAQSLLIGAILVNGSFLLLKRDARRLIHKVSLSQTVETVVIASEKTRFFLRTFARLIVVGLLLFVIANHISINVIGLILGCVTVVVSIVIIGLSAGRCWTLNKV
ncbi:MAG: ATP synthase subunit I [Desulfobulbus sp.]|nr:ATP synthase subunit I [Desulfobulbus sp.]